MRLESLPNEILLDLFCYFNGIDLLRAFHSLNTRFNLLLYKQFRSYLFQLNFVSKRDFDMMCQQHLPWIIGQVIVLQLSDYKETPEQITLFLSYISSFKLFIHLQSLTISYLQLYQKLLKLLDECQNVPNLTRLCFYSCYIQDSLADSKLIIDKIWSLSKLTYCHIDVIIAKDRQFNIPIIISTSLSSVLQWNQVNQLIE